MLQACCFILNYNAILDLAPETDQYDLEPGLCIQFNRKCVRFTHYWKHLDQCGKRNEMPSIGRTVIHKNKINDQFLNTTPNKEALIRLISD